MDSNQSWHKHNYRTIILPNLHFEFCTENTNTNCLQYFGYIVWCKFMFWQFMHTYIDTRTRTCIHNTHSQAADNCDRFRFLNRISRILWGGCLEIQIFYCLRTKLHEIPYHTAPDVVGSLEFSPRWYQTIEKRQKNVSCLVFFSSFIH